MKKIIAVFVIAAASLLPAAAQNNLYERTLSLDESLTAGLQNNQEFLSLKEQEQIARQQVQEAHGQIFPKIDFNLSLSHFNNDMPTVLPQSFESLYLPAGSQNLYYHTRLSLWQYLYASGRYSTNVRLAEINLSQAQSQVDAVKNRIMFEIKKDYYRCLSLKEKIRLLEASLTDLSKNSSRRTGDEAALKRQLREAEFELRTAKLHYLQSMGLELDCLIDVKGELTAPIADYDLNKCLAWAFQYRPELRQTQFQETIDRLRVNLSLAERYPTVMLGASYEWAGGNLPLDETSWNATVNVNLPIFDGWTSWARIRQRRHQARSGKIQRAAIEDQVRYDVREAFIEHGYWRERLTEEISSPGRELERIETIYRANVAAARLEWAIGKPFFR